MSESSDKEPYIIAFEVQHNTWEAWITVYRDRVEEHRENDGTWMKRSDARDTPITLDQVLRRYGEKAHAKVLAAVEKMKGACDEA